MTKRWLPMPRIIFDDTGICFGEPPSVLATIFLIIPDDVYVYVYVYVFKNKEEEERWRKSLGLASWWVYIRWPCLLACVRVCTIQLREYLRIEPVFSLSRARHCLRQCREPAAASFQPERKAKEKRNETMRAAAGGRIYTHTHIEEEVDGEWINNLGSQWSSFEFCVVIRSVGREKQNHNIRMCARKNRKQPNGKKIETREWWAFLLLLKNKKKQNLQFKNSREKRNFFKKFSSWFQITRARSTLFGPYGR